MFKSFLKEFRTFAMRGNVIDMAVGIIIGGAFGKIVDSLVKDILMPPIGLLLGKVDFTNLYVIIRNPNPEVSYASLSAAQQAGAVTLNIGMFLNSFISFLIVAFAVFLLIKGINKVQAEILKGEEPAAPNTKTCPYCFSSVNINATRCPNCTSELTVQEISNTANKKLKTKKA